MKAYLQEFLEEFDYPMESRQVLTGAFEKIGQAGEEYARLMEAYRHNKDCDYDALAAKMDEVSAQAEIHPYTGRLLLYIGLSRQLKEFYRQAGIDLAIWHGSMLDLKYKLLECHALHHIWGTFVNWFGGFFNLTRFALGRLQFDKTTFNRSYSKNGVDLTPQSKVLNVHIPRTLTPLAPAEVEKSYDMAHSFFREWFGEEPTVFVCHSWLLFPRHRQMLPEGSNILSFMDGFDIVENGLNDDYQEIWRFFDCPYTPDLDRLPQNGSLRRAYVALMRRGEKTGWGFGVRVY